jgi:hypothetical protein
MHFNLLERRRKEHENKQRKSILQRNSIKQSLGNSGALSDSNSDSAHSRLQNMREAQRIVQKHLQEKQSKFKEISLKPSPLKNPELSQSNLSQSSEKLYKELKFTRKKNSLVDNFHLEKPIKQLRSHPRMKTQPVVKLKSLFSKVRNNIKKDTIVDVIKQKVTLARLQGKEGSKLETDPTKKYSAISGFSIVWLLWDGVIFVLYMYFLYRTAMK